MHDIWGGQKFKRLYPTLNCISSCFSGYHLITVCNEACYSKCENTNAWYETDFISSFAALIAHKNHVGSIQFVHCLLPMEKVARIANVQEIEGQCKKGCKCLSWQ